MEAEGHYFPDELGRLGMMYTIPAIPCCNIARRRGADTSWGWGYQRVGTTLQIMCDVRCLVSSSEGRVCSPQFGKGDVGPVS